MVVVVAMTVMVIVTAGRGDGWYGCSLYDDISNDGDGDGGGGGRRAGS